MINHRQQRGVTLVGMLLWGIIIVFLALLAMKLIPAYTEYLEIKRILKDIGSEEGVNGMSNAEIRERFSKRAMIDNISSISASDLRIGRGNGRTLITAEYTFQTPLVANVSLLADFSVSSDSREGSIEQRLE
jgi:hypothetical protein